MSMPNRAGEHRIEPGRGDPRAVIGRGGIDGKNVKGRGRGPRRLLELSFARLTLAPLVLSASKHPAHTTPTPAPGRPSAHPNSAVVSQPRAATQSLAKPPFLTKRETTTSVC